MKNIRGLLALLLVFIMVAQIGIVGVSAVTVDSNGQPTKYSTTSNAGKRHIAATTLNGTNVASYYKVYTFSNNEYDFTYESLSAQSGNTLLNSLRTLLTKTHHTTTNYDDDCRNRLDETDCQEGNGKVMLLYSNKEISWSSSFTNYNREHVWPKSLGGYSESGPGADLHHIRPTDNRINSIRNNNKFGQSSLVAGQHGSAVTGGNGASGIVGGYLGRGYFEPLDNVKGDVARICLYMYARYGGDRSFTCDKITNVFESVDVLLAWCELDPVDTWELGRNEVVGKIQGNRNVFIDYPELAWKIFDRNVPENMTTPSKGSNSGTTNPTTKPNTPTEAPTEAPTTAPTTPSVDPSVTGSAAISFADTANRVSVSSDSQVWKQNGITVINNKAASSQSINGTYYNPVRIYAHTSLTVQASGMIKISFNLNTSSKPITGLVNSVKTGGNVLSCTSRANVVTIEFTEPVDSFVINDVSAQFQIDSLTVYVATAEPDDPGTDNPGTDNPGTDNPGTDNPGTDNPGTDNPGTDNPGTDNPGTDNPGTDNPGTDNPGTDNPGTDNPGTDNPGTDNPGTDNPGTDNPGTDNPGTDNPGTDNPGTDNPGTDNPGTDNSGSAKEPTGFIAWLISIINAILAIFGLRMVV